MEKLIKVNKIDKELKTSMGVRVKTGILMAVFGAIVITLFAFSDETSGTSIKDGWVWWIPESAHQYVSFACALLAIAILSCFAYFIAKEIENCFIGTGNKKIIGTITFGLLLIQLIPTLIWMLPHYFPTTFLWENGLAGLSSNWWWLIFFFIVGTILVVIFLFVFIHLMKYSKRPTRFNKIMFPIIAVGIAIAFGSIYYLSIIRSWTTLILLLLAVCGCDIMAYFSGVLFGKHKMAPIISPKKSWEGAIIGGIAGAALVVLFVFLFGLVNHDPTQLTSTNAAVQFFGIQFLSIDEWCWGAPNQWIWWLAISIVAIVLVIATIFGDLLFSLLKRRNNIKDFSNALPGHGGFLDRMDAFLLVVFTFGIIMLGIALFTAIYNNEPSTVFPNFIEQ